MTNSQAARPELSKGEQSRRVILDAAKRLILERGFSAVTLQDILDAAAVTKGRFFHHFSSKDALFSELLRDALTERTVLDYKEIASRAPSSRAFDQLLFLFDRIIEWHEKGLAQELRLCLLATFFFAPTSPEILRINDILAANTKALEILIRHAQNEGDLPAEIDPAVLSLLFPSAAVGANLVGYLSSQDRLTPRSLVELRKLIAAAKFAGQREAKEGRSE